MNYLPTRPLLAAVFLIAGSAHGATIVTDDFTYSNGSLSGNNGGTGWSGAWQTVGGQSSTTVSSGSALASGTNWNYRQFTTTFDGTTSALYFSATFTKSGSDTAYALWSAIGTTTGFNPNGVSFGMADNKFSLRLRGASGETSADFGSITVGQTYTIVGKLEFNVGGANERVTIWVDPTDIETASLVSSAITGRDVGWTTPSVADVGSFVFDAPSQGLIDNFKIGDTWASVAVPEPSAISLLSVVIGGLLIRRRR